MTKKQTEIGRVQEVFVGIEDHGILAIAVKVKCASCFQGYGHFAIDDWKTPEGTPDAVEGSKS